jgi:hypothetical protein
MTDNMFKNAKTLQEAVGNAVGAASVAWHDNGVFNEKQATKIVDDLLARIQQFTTPVDPRYRRAGLDAAEPEELMKLYAFYVGDSDTPLAGYHTGDGQYDAFFDFESAYCGSPLADIVGDITWKEWTENNEANDLHVQVRAVRVPDIHHVDEVTGLSIQMIRESAYAWLAHWAYQLDPAKTIATLIWDVIE